MTPPVDQAEIAVTTPAPLLPDASAIVEPLRPLLAPTPPARRIVRRETAVAAALCAALSAALVLFGPLGVDGAAHRYLTLRYDAHGFGFWDNYWYAGRYEFINYSLLFYPLASLAGELLVAAAAVTTGATLFASLVVRQWGTPARWSARLFALSAPALLVSGQYPFSLGCAFALAALVCLQRDRPWLLLLAALCALLASPLAFLLLVVLLFGLAASHADSRLLARPRYSAPLVLFAMLGAGMVLVFRAFPAGGNFPYPTLDLLGITAFSLAGAAFAWRSERTRPLVGIFLACLALGVGSKLYPSALGGNATRILEFASAPLLLLVTALRGFRPRFFSLLALCVALVWQAAPLARNAVGLSTEQATSPAFWGTPLSFFDPGLNPAHRDWNYRVEVVATWGHLESYYLAGNGIPIVRGWFRQDDFPQNTLFYRGKLDAGEYQRWLRDMGVRYVLLPHDELDASARAEAELLLSGTSGLSRLQSTSTWTIYELPDPTRIVTPPPAASADARDQTQIMSLTGDGIAFYAPVPGTYQLRVRYTPYWRVDDPSAACVQPGRNPMSQVVVQRPGPVRVQFHVSLRRAASAVDGSTGSCLFPPRAAAG